MQWGTRLILMSNSDEMPQSPSLLLYSTLKTTHFRTDAQGDGLCCQRDAIGPGGFSLVTEELIEDCFKSIGLSANMMWIAKERTLTLTPATLVAHVLFAGLKWTSYRVSLGPPLQLELDAMARFLNPSALQIVLLHGSHWSATQLYLNALCLATERVQVSGKTFPRQSPQLFKQHPLV